MIERSTHVCKEIDKLIKELENVYKDQPEKFRAAIQRVDPDIKKFALYHMEREWAKVTNDPLLGYFYAHSLSEAIRSTGHWPVEVKIGVEASEAS